MITRNRTPWQNSLKQMTTNISALLEQLHLTPEQVNFSEDACQDFPLRVPAGFIARMKKGDPKDPLLMQVLPITDELESENLFSAKIIHGTLVPL